MTNYIYSTPPSSPLSTPTHPMSVEPHYIQFFVRNVEELRESNYPLIRFESRAHAYEFILQMISEKALGMSTGYLILNNPQLLPRDVRKEHQYSVIKIPDEDEDEGDEEVTYTIRDGCYSIERNIALLKSVVEQIENNSLVDHGFQDFVRAYPNTFSQL